MCSNLAVTKIERYLEIINPLVYSRRLALEPFRYQQLTGTQVALSQFADDRSGVLIPPNSYWSDWQTNFLLSVDFQVPEDWNRDLPGALFLPIGKANDFSHPEALVYIDDKPIAACDRHHQEIILPDKYMDGGLHRLILQGWTGMQHWNGSEPGSRLFMKTCEMVQIDLPTRDFIATARVCVGVLKNIDDNSPVFGKLLNALNGAFNLLDLTEPFGEGFYSTIRDAHKFLLSGTRAAGPALGVSIWAIGQSHIDLAWLWTLDQTRLKAGRTFHTILHLMELFPDFKFSQSQPQLYEFVRQDYPDLFASIQRRVEEGQWEILGGMWVEPDCNLSGAEALVRQLLLGRSFYQEHFSPGAESPVLWLPDTFGFPWSLPQLLAKSGIRYFVTIKMGWNQTNRMPYDSFWWQGLDGTRILTHFASNECNVFLSPENVLKAWEKYPQKAECQEIALLYGWGDGGGGPTSEMLENLREMNDFPALPQVHSGTVKDFFECLESTADEHLPAWNGELYLEKHRGVYTTQARIKRANRKIECALHDAEFLASTALLLDPDYQYPAELAQQIWKQVCLNQFHDILPGSSIGEVYVEAMRQYAEIEEAGGQIRNAALHSIASKIGGDLMVVNPIGFRRSDLALWPVHFDSGQSLQHSNGTPVWMQPVSGGTLVYAGELPPYSVTPLYLVDQHPRDLENSMRAGKHLLENNFLCVEFNEHGEIVRLFDKTCQRDVLSTAQVGNQFQFFEDRPIDSDAWDIEASYESRPIAIKGSASIRVVETGPLRATIEVKRQILHSHFIQRISLVHNSSQIDFETYVDWHERHTLLKVAFPVEILSPFATYEIQWGNIQRATHRNTSWDQARFEVCAQKWVDLSEGGYGVSLLNDCKYGHDIHENVIRLSLLRGSTSPDPQADQGEHRFSYSLLLHKDGWESITAAHAYALNHPLTLFQGKKSVSPSMFSFIESDAPNVIVETVKAAEDGNGLIVRLYEHHRKRGPITLRTGFNLAEVWRTDLLEKNEEVLSSKDRQVVINICPFDIVTLRFVPRT